MRGSASFLDFGLGNDVLDNFIDDLSELLPTVSGLVHDLGCVLEGHENLEDDLGDLGEEVDLLHDLLVALLVPFLVLLLLVDFLDGLH